jgi:F-type H+-transporting ATPase subunit b
MLDINPGLILWTIVTFVLLLAVLRKFAWGPIVGALSDREQGIRKAIEDAQKAQAESQKILEENRKQLAKADEEARRILNEGRALAEQLKNDITEKANQQSRRMIEQAKQEIDRDKEAALAQLRGEVASLAVLAAGKILNETLDASRHQKLIDDILKNLPKN